jgi:hypothetical protein
VFCVFTWFHVCHAGYRARSARKRCFGCAWRLGSQEQADGRSRSILQVLLLVHRIIFSHVSHVLFSYASSHADVQLMLTAALQRGTLTLLSCLMIRREMTRRARCCIERCSLLLRTASRTHHRHYSTTNFSNTSQLAVTTTTALCYTAWDCWTRR